MPGKTITCPYCFKLFDDADVHFRMETTFTENELDSTGQKRFKSDIESDFNSNDAERKKILKEYERREAFVPREDAQYEFFWRDFGGTTEEPSKSRDGALAVMPYHRPVFNPHAPEHAPYFEQTGIEDDYGMIISATDCFGANTTRRVCPHCHNPLPGTYGKHEVEFVSIIGITGAGKTVYLSQLCRHFNTYTGKVAITSIPTTGDARAYIHKNVVAMKTPLPVGSPPERLTQPIFFDMTQRINGKQNSRTMVIYDIAGENCVDPEKMKKFGAFVEHSDGILILIDPVQFEMTGSYSKAAEPVEVLNTIYNLFANKNQESVCKIPLAICISKGDKIAGQIIGGNLAQTSYVRDTGGMYQPLFNAADYNPMQEKLRYFIQENDNNLFMHLSNLYNNYNYFLFSAIGTSTETVNIDGVEFDAPAGPPIPARIDEPILWIFHKLGYIKSHGKINEPKASEPKEEGWTCTSCGRTGNMGLKCENKKCKRDQLGKKGFLWF